jgi:glycosyltransferase involved in cell wall biosynthesis
MKNAKESGSLSICLVTFHNFPEGKGGGEERFLENFSKFLADMDIQVTIVSSTTKSNNENIVGAGIRPFRLPFFGLTPYLLLFSVIASMRIISLNKRRNFSLIHSIDIGYGGLAGLFASRILGLPLIVHSMCKRPYLLKLTLLMRDGFTRHVAYLYEKFEVSIDELISRNANLILAVSNEIKSYISSLGVPSEKIVVSPVGVNAAAFEPKPKDREELFHEFGLPLNAFVIGYVGSLVKAKGIDVLLRAFSLLQNRVASMNLYLLMVGNGDHKKEIENMVKEMRLQSVIVPGFREDLPKVLAAMDVFVLPSLSEGCPFSLLEAMAAGKAIIASNIPSIREIVEEEKEALLVNPQDANMLEKAILRLNDNRELIENLGRNAQKKVRRYDMDLSFSQIVRLYNYYREGN